MPMKVADLMTHWQSEFGSELSAASYSLPLKSQDAARVEALTEMFPSMTREQILRDLISAALDDLTSGFPYVAGDKVVAEDEEGFPLYEDVGLTPRFLELTRKHLNQTQEERH
ncbi:type 1 pili tip component [Thalassolituus sp.]|uniref:type 1 pili tip component n=1 Tax=Thalassolituus sp. TaxID=2030822 RepID=UPI00263738AF|nr:type 1 pili tip component [uncultured Thalassolituus sp.]